MKIRILSLSIFFILISGATELFAAGKKSAPQPEQKDTYEYDLIVTSITEVKAPYVSGNYIVFTAPNTARTIGIAFDFENFNKIHNFQLHKNYGYEGDVTSSYYFYLLEKPKKLHKIYYRLIIDGLWTTDPTNSNVFYNNIEGYTLSCINIPYTEKFATETLDNGLTHFVCFAESGKKIRLGGTFTNWDSWIYEMKETTPGRYEIDLPLHAGTYYYSYYNGISSFIDETNPQKGYASDGRIVSCITIK